MKEEEATPPFSLAARTKARHNEGQKEGNDGTELGGEGRRGGLDPRGEGNKLSRRQMPP